jgi:Flp pilus assembly pilin Flp
VADACDTGAATGNYNLYLNSKGAAMMAKVKNFFNDETGSELGRHAVTAALVAVFCVTTFIALNGGLTATLQNLKEIIWGS